MANLEYFTILQFAHLYAKYAKWPKLEIWMNTFILLDGIPILDWLAGPVLSSHQSEALKVDINFSLEPKFASSSQDGLNKIFP